MKYPYLDKIQKNGDVKKLPQQELPLLCEDIRNFLIESVSSTGGHLSSNLGVVELTVALHRALTLPQDKILFDVGHQCYTHKLLTGRREGFAHLRQVDGLSGFPSPQESDCDTFIAGHGSTALSTCASLVGAPLTHDFCSISLSDLLTPWPVIAKRIEAAARADFVIETGRPKSYTRRQIRAIASCFRAR